MAKTLRKAVRRPRGTYRGVLAEDWDGRRRQVLVSASLGSSSSALVNVLSPVTSPLEAGTPVLLKQINGKVYIVSGTGRLGRLCEDFDRLQDEVAITASSIDEDATEVWGESPHEAEWAWQGVTATNPAPGNDVAGIDVNGAYVIAGGANRDIYVETPEGAVVVDYAFDIYVRIRSLNLGNEKFALVFDSSEEDLTAYVKVSLHFDTTGGYRILTNASDSTLLPFDFVANTWYWVRIGYYPGDSVGVAIWEDTGDEDDEPDTYLYELNTEDGAYIPEEINKFQMQWLNIDAADKITVSSIRIFGHCTEWTLDNPREGDPCGAQARITTATNCAGFGGRLLAAYMTDNGGSIVADPDFDSGYCLEAAAAGSSPGGLFQFPNRSRMTASIEIKFISGSTIQYFLLGRRGSAHLFEFRRIGGSGSAIQASLAETGHQTGPGITDGVVYRIDFALDLSANPHRLRWSVDGVAQTDVTRSAAADTIDIFGLFWNGVTTGTVRYGNVLYSNDSQEALDEYPYGAVRVLGYPITGDGAHNVESGSFQKSTGPTAITDGTTDAYDHIDEVPLTTGPGDYDSQQSTDAEAYIAFTHAQSAETDGIAVIRVSFEVIGANNTQQSAYLDDAVLLLNYNANSSSGRGVGGTTNTNPSNGLRWDTDSFNDSVLTWGYSADVGVGVRPGILGAYLDVAYTADLADCPDDLP